jgi:glutamine synthetase
VEAEKRGLINYRDSVTAIEHFTDSDTVAVLERYGVLSSREIRSRAEILLEGYATTVAIEGNVALDMAKTILLPAAFAWQRDLAATAAGLEAVLGKAEAMPQRRLLQTVSKLTREFMAAIDSLEKALEKAGAVHGDAKKAARACRDAIVPAMAVCREAADALELLLDDALWPVPKYREMLWLY